MATHAVGKAANRKEGLVKTTALTAELQLVAAQAKPGDQITLAEGKYYFGADKYVSLAIRGAGSPERAILTGGRLTFQGTSSLSNCTIECSKFGKPALAVHVSGSGSTLRLQNVVVTSPARTHNRPHVLVGPGTTTWAYGSSLGRVVVDGGTLHLSPSNSVSDLTCLNGGAVYQVPDPTNYHSPPTHLLGAVYANSQIYAEQYVPAQQEQKAKLRARLDKAECKAQECWQRAHALDREIKKRLDVMDMLDSRHSYINVATGQRYLQDRYIATWNEQARAARELTRQQRGAEAVAARAEKQAARLRRKMSELDA
ncbi:hypothetical protein AB4Z09_27260 [Rhodococcus sp. TAF43]|uniref:hypothetical protein n=1 Tax=Rhodococcus sp. TAF43 TaxID=3237483 RepID=UPI003F98EB6F